MPSRRAKRKFLLFVLIAFIAFYYIGGMFMPHGGWQQGPAEVDVAEVLERDVRQWNDFSGLLVAMDQVDVRPQVSGIIQKVHFQDGAMVKKGDMLFTIDPRPYQAALESARAHAQLTASEFARAQQLIADKAISQRDYDQRKNDAAVANAALTTARLNLQYTAVRAPISGRASRAEITEGNLVETNTGAPVLTSIVSVSPIYADFEVDEHTFLQYVDAHATDIKDASQIPVTIALSNDTPPIEGHVQSFDNRLNPSSGTLRVRAVFENPDGLLVPGLFARVRLGAAADTHAILVTDRAIATDQDKKMVYVVGDDNKVEYREVKLGPLTDGLRVVASGLKSGEKIIVNGLQRAHPGAPVKATVVPMDPKDTPPPANPDEQKKAP